MSHDNNLQGTRIVLAGIKTTRRGRTVDERVFVQFPALSHAAARFLYRLPTRSRLRRRLLARRVVQATAAVNRRDLDLLLTGFHPELDWWIAPGGGVVPELVGHHLGHAGYRKVFQNMLEAFEDLTWEPEELIDLGDRLFGVTLVTGHGSSSGVPVSTRLFQVFTFRRGLIIKEEDFATREEALEAAGLRE